VEEGGEEGVGEVGVCGCGGGGHGAQGLGLAERGFLVLLKGTIACSREGDNIFSGTPEGPYLCIASSFADLHT